MVSDNDIAYAESQVRRLREILTVKKREGTPEEVKQLEEELKLKERDVRDLSNRKRQAEDQERRETIQKNMDERRKRFA